MKNSITVALLLLGLFSGQAADERALGKPVITVTADARSHAITKGTDGEVRVAKLTRSFSPGIRCYPSGRAIITRLNGKEIQTTINREAMDALGKAFQAPGFISITPELLRERMDAFDAATHTRFGVEDGGFWTISVNRGTTNHTLTVEAPFTHARHYTNVAEFKVITNLIALTYASAGMKIFE